MSIDTIQTNWIEIIAALATLAWGTAQGLAIRKRWVHESIINPFLIISTIPIFAIAIFYLLLAIDLEGFSNNTSMRLLIFRPAFILLTVMYTCHWLNGHINAAQMRIIRWILKR